MIRVIGRLDVRTELPVAAEERSVRSARRSLVPGVGAVEREQQPDSIHVTVLAWFLMTIVDLARTPGIALM